MGRRSRIDAQISLPGRPASVSAGRRFVRETLRAWRAEPFIELAELAASELITNAVLHAQSSPEVRLVLKGSRLRLEVADSSPVEPTTKSYGPDAGTGRGMVLVEHLSSDWGADAGPHGKTVWCEFEPVEAARGVSGREAAG